jgi:hypothetical protein
MVRGCELILSLIIIHSLQPCNSFVVVQNYGKSNSLTELKMSSHSPAAKQTLRTSAKKTSTPSERNRNRETGVVKDSYIDASSPSGSDQQDTAAPPDPAFEKLLKDTLAEHQNIRLFVPLLSLKFLAMIDCNGSQYVQIFVQYPLGHCRPCRGGFSGTQRIAGS